MAVATFQLPLASLNSLLKITKGLWMPRRFEELSGLGTSEFLTSDVGAPVWYSDIALAPMQMADFRTLRSRIMLLNGSANMFLFASPESMYPASDPFGVAVAASTVLVHTVGGDNKTLRLKGLPATYVITEGDFLSITYNGGRQALHVANETVTAVAGVTPTFEVRPHLRPGMLADDPVQLDPPEAKVKILPDTLGWDGSGEMVTVRFQVQQTLGL
jgi:hypothetical protein